jgi:beta-galactosidase
MNQTSRGLFGAEIQYFRTDPRYWPALIRQLKDTGLRCATTYVQWGTHLIGPPDKKHPAGILDFEGKTNPRLNLLKFLDLVQDSGLNLNFRCGPFCCNEAVHGGYPPWLVLGDPEMMVWDYQNRTTQGYWIGKKEGSQPSYLHPEYLAWCKKWFAEVDPIIRPRLKSKGGFITMVNLDNEISYIVKDSFLDSDYNPVNVRPGGYWEQFLHEKYGRGAKLRPPPRAVPETIGDDLAWYTDWIEFKTWCMCGYIRELRAMHEANGVKDVTFMTNFNPHLPEGVPTRMSDFEQAVGPGGIVGYDFYRGTFMSYSGYQSMARVLKLMNASLRYTWSAEFMSGTWNKVLSGRVSDDHMRFMARCALAQGCKAIDWFMFHDRDCWGDAPVSSHGHPRPSLQVLKETPDLLFNKIRNWDALVPHMDVAVVYDLIQHQHTAIGDPMPCNDNDLPIGKPAIDGVAAGKASTEYVGLFRLIEENGYQAGVVDILHSPKRLQGYPLVFLPGSPVIERAAMRAIASYLKRGGVVVLTGAWPTRDERGKPLAFLGRRAPQRDPVLRVGQGQLVWRKAFIAQDKPEEESLASVAWVGQLLKAHVGAPHVGIRPVQSVTWVDWQQGGGHREYVQPRNLGSAVLHRADGECVLFVMNHYVDAVRFEVTLSGTPSGRLVDLDTGAQTPLRRGRAIVDVDRKSCAVYRVEA